MNSSIDRIRRAAAVASAGLLAAAALLAAPAPARPADASAAKPSCGDMPFRDRTRVTTDGDANVAGVVFRPQGDRFHIWDNKRDGELAWVSYNYAGVDDDWKRLNTVFDGGQGQIRHNLREGRQICFQLQVVGYPDSPIVRYATSPGGRTSAAGAKPSCGDMPFQDRVRVATRQDANVAGVVFRPRGDRFHIWDNDREGHQVWIDYNYAGVADRWKTLPTVQDGAQGEIRRDLAEGRQICFRIRTDNPGYPDSPVVRYRTSG